MSGGDKSGATEQPVDASSGAARDAVAQRAPLGRPLVPAVDWVDDRVVVIDQTLLPERFELRELRGVEAVVDALARLVVRGAPAIGVCGAFGVVLGIDELGVDAGPLEAAIDAIARRLGGARPTAVNLEWAVRRVVAATRGATDRPDARRRALAEALRICEEDRASCRRIGEFGRAELAAFTRIMTHCNAGRLATSGSGTALAPLYAKALAGEPVEVVATETRPLLQGARLTAWELDQAGIPVTLVTDGSVAAALRSGAAHAVVVGCDRVAANGDTANKIGTYACALAARAAGVPLYVAGPMTSFDSAVNDGDGIVIEERDPDEVRRVGECRTAPFVNVWNPAFDVTPAELITAFITDTGVLRPPFASSIAAALEEARRQGWC